jgi:hypothetical protein
MWKTMQRYAAVLVPQQQDDFLPLTNQQAEQLVTQQSRSRHELLNDMGESLSLLLRSMPAPHLLLVSHSTSPAPVSTAQQRSLPEYNTQCW